MKYKTDYRVKAYDLNIRDEIKPTELDQYLQETADRQMRDLDIPYETLVREHNKAFIISRLNVEIYGSLRAGDIIDATTWITYAKAANFPRAYELHQDNELKARAYSNWALVDTETKRLVRNSEYDTTSYPHDDEPEMDIPHKFRIPRDLEMKDAGDFEVGFYMTDINKHMNNAKYLNQIAGYIPDIEKHTITSFNIRYVHEAVQGQTVKVTISDFVDPEGMDSRADRIVYIKTYVEDEPNIEAVFGLKWND